MIRLREDWHAASWLVNNVGMPVLEPDVVDARLNDLPGWIHEGNELIKVYELRTFPGAIAFVTWVGFLAERANHHPDIDIRWRKVRVKLSTHSEGGITDKDFELATQIDDISGLSAIS